jgi:hypothetical protein
LQYCIGIAVLPIPFSVLPKYCNTFYKKCIGIGIAIADTFSSIDNNYFYQ